MRRRKSWLLALIGVLLFLAPQRARADTTGVLRPVADGGEDSALWSAKNGTACSSTDCSTEVDESSGSSCADSDGDASYVESNAQNAAQTFDISLATIPDSATISRVDISVCHVKGQTGQPNKFRTRYCANGSCTNADQDLTPAATYGERTQSFAGLAVTKTDATDLEIGVIVVDANNALVRVSQISALITYSTSGGGEGGNGGNGQRPPTPRDRRPLYHPEGRDEAPIHFVQGKVKKALDGSEAREIRSSSPDAPMRVTARPAEPDELRSLRLRTHGRVYLLTDPEGDGTYALPAPLFLPPGTHPYSLTADYGTTSRTEYGAFVVNSGAKASFLSGGLPETLSLLNRLFRAAFGREPSFSDWRYWANRLVNGEKRSALELYGAMQWQRAAGRDSGAP